MYMFSNKSSIETVSKLVLFSQVIVLVLTISSPIAKIPLGILAIGTTLMNHFI